MPSKDVLKEAVKAFDGTAIIVSHDRDFLDGLVSKVYEFGGGKVREHLGGVYEWLRSLQQRDDVPTMKAQPVVKAAAPATAPAATAPAAQGAKAGENAQGAQGAKSSKDDYLAHKEQQKKISRVKKAVDESERKIAEMEARLKELDTLLMDPKNASDMKLVTEYTTTQSALDKENDHWMELSEKLEEMGQ